MTTSASVSTSATKVGPRGFGFKVGPRGFGFKVGPRGFGF